MEVPGRRALASDSDQDTQVLASSQSNLALTIASEHCTHCKEALCVKCTKQHKLARLSSSYRILDAQEMPRRNLASGTINTCAKDGRDVKHYCQDHDEFCCKPCCKVRHGRCKVLELTTMVSRFEKSNEYTSLKDDLDRILRQTEQTQDKIKDNRSVVTISYDQMLADIQDFRSEINARLDSLENELRDEVEGLKSASDALLDYQEKCLEDVVREVIEISTRMGEEEQLQHIESMVILTKKAYTYINEYEKELGTITNQLEETVDELCHFVRNTELETLLSISKFGELETKTQTITEERPSLNPIQDITHFEGKIGIRHPRDTHDCRITGCVELSKDILAVADHNNACVKLVNMNRNDVISHIKLPVKPWDITRVNEHELVVTSDDKLVFVDVSDSHALSLGRELLLNGLCSGIDYFNGNLVVSFLDPNPAVKVIDISGRVLRTVPKDTREDLFTSPFYVATGNNTHDVFVADYDRNRVTCIDTDDGIIKYIYEDEKLIGPYGLARDEIGGMFVVGCGSSNIHYITRTCEEGHISFDQGERTQTPQALAYCGESGKLVLSHSQVASQLAGKSHFAGRSVANTLSVSRFQRR